MCAEYNSLIETHPVMVEKMPTGPTFPAGDVGEMSFLRIRAADVALVASLSNEDEAPVTQAVRILEDFETYVGHATIDLPSIEGLSEVEKTAVVVSALVHDMRDQVVTDATEILIGQKEAAENEADELREMIDVDTVDLLKQNVALQKEVDRLKGVVKNQNNKYTRLQGHLHDQALIAANKKLEGPRRFVRTVRARGSIALRATVLPFKTK